MLDLQMDLDMQTNLFIFVVLIFLVFYVSITAFLENKHLPIHRSAVAILIGVCVGLVLYLFSNDSYQILVEFNDTIVFSILFPPMVFAEGYNFKKSQFLKNIRHIGLFGVFGTFIQFTITVLLIYGANQLNLVRDAKDINNVRTLADWEILLMGACFCSIDNVASVDTVSQAKYPKLSSIFFGETLFKDTIAVVLLRSVMRLQGMQSPKNFIFYWYTPFNIILNFLLLIVSSVLIGLIFGLIVTKFFKSFRFLGHNEGISQTALLFLLGFLLHVGAQMINTSGPIAILTFGLVLNKYNSYNLSQQGRLNAKSTFTVISILCEGLLFLIMGTMVWVVSWKSGSDGEQITHSWIFMISVALILILARVISVYGLGLLIGNIWKRFKLNLAQLKIVCISGLVRGATPFALFTSVTFPVDNNDQYGKNQGLILKSTVIIIVIYSSVFVNSLIPKLYKNSLKKLSSQGIQQALQTFKDALQHENQVKQQLLNKQQRQQANEQGQKKSKKKMFIQMSQKFKNKWHSFDEKYLKPFFIYNYLERKQALIQQKLNTKKQKITALFKAQNKEQILQQEVKNQVLKTFSEDLIINKEN